MAVQLHSWEAWSCSEDRSSVLCLLTCIIAVSRCLTLSLNKTRAKGGYLNYSALFIVQWLCFMNKYPKNEKLLPLLPHRAFTSGKFAIKFYRVLCLIFLLSYKTDQHWAGSDLAWVPETRAPVSALGDHLGQSPAKPCHGRDWHNVTDSSYFTSGLWPQVQRRNSRK